MHKHTCLNCNKVIAEGNFDCESDRDHDFALCDDCLNGPETRGSADRLAYSLRGPWKEQGR